MKGRKVKNQHGPYLFGYTSVRQIITQVKFVIPCYTLIYTFSSRSQHILCLKLMSFLKLIKQVLL